MSELRRQHNSYVLVFVPDLLIAGETQLEDSEGKDRGDPLMRQTEGVQTAGAVTKLLKPCSCQHETTQQQLCSSHVSAQFSWKSIQPSTKMFGWLSELQP